MYNYNFKIMWNNCGNDWHYNVEAYGIWGFFWVGILIIIYLMLKAYLDSKKEKDSTLEMLKRKYASGEISTEEYEERKKVLEK